MIRRRTWAWPAALLLVLAIAWPGRVIAARQIERPGAPASAPNIVLILTDDQRWDTLWSMPYVQSEMVAKGITFSNAMVVNSLCCPSRSTILTGQYSHTTQVYANTGPYGGFESFHSDNNTMATWLQGGGYRTALMGKYLNGYDTTYIPPNWDRWVAFMNVTENGDYYNYDLNVDGTDVHYGSAETDYSTDVLSGYADDFIRTTPTDQPLFLYWAPKAPHAPSTSAQKYKDLYKGLPPWRPANYNEADVSDKPAWLQAQPLLTTQAMKTIDNRRKNMYRTLRSVDDAVNTIITALSDTNRLANTLIVFASDNGYDWGEHRMTDKLIPYEESIRVPMVARWDGVISPRTDPHLVANVDLAPTFADVGGVPAVGAEGMDMTPLFTDPSAPWRQDLLVEHMQNTLVRDPVTTYCEIRDDSFQPEGFTFVKYSTGEEELYDLKTDVYQLTNVAADATYHTQLVKLRNILNTLCNPRPPGWPTG